MSASPPSVVRPVPTVAAALLAFGLLAAASGAASAASAPFAVSPMDGFSAASLSSAPRKAADEGSIRQAPAPAALVLLGASLAALGLVARRRHG